MEQINYQLLDGIASKYGTPFYLMDGIQYKKNITDFLNAFRNRYEKIIAGYSFKTNYVPALCHIAKVNGLYAEVVSEMEYALAKKIGFDHIIFNGPIKKKDVLIDAIESDVIVNLDSMYEVDVLCEYNCKCHHNLNVGLRVNIDLTDEHGVSKVQNGLREGRFGFPKEILDEAILKLRNSDINIVSIHGHTSSSDRAVVNYELITKQMLSVCEKYSLDNVQYFDIGGGFFGAAAEGIDVSTKPRYQDYANAILDIVLENEWFKKHSPSIVIEPGVSVVANVFTYVSQVFQHKVINGKNFITTDGTVFDVKPTLHSNNLPFQVYTKNPSNEHIICDYVGSTCMEKDIILKDVKFPKAQYGDYVLIKGVGAYTISLTPTFINYISPIFEIHGKDINIVRRRQTIDDIITLYNW